MEDNEIICWIGIDSDGKVTPHSIFDVQSAIYDDEVTGTLDWSTAVTTKPIAERGWGYFSKWIKKVCVGISAPIMAEIVSRANDYGVGKLSVFADSDMLYELSVRDCYPKLIAVSKVENVFVPGYKVSCSTPIGTRGAYMLDMEAIPLTELDENGLNHRMELADTMMKLPRPSDKEMSEINRVLMDIEAINMASDYGNYGVRSDYDVASAENSDHMVFRMSEVMDDICVSMNKMEKLVNDQYNRTDALEKLAKATAAMTLNNKQKIEGITNANDENIEDVRNQIAIVVEENSENAKKARNISILAAVASTVVAISAIVVALFN